MSPKMPKVKDFKNPNMLVEIYQKTGILFAFASQPDKKGNMEQCHEWAKCRDFLPDAVRAQITGKKCGIYGFTYTPGGKNPPIDLNKMRLLVANGNPEQGQAPISKADFRRKMEKALIVVNQFEKQGKISLSKMIEVEHSKRNGKEDLVVLFVGSGIWMKSPFLVSLYTFLIRLGDKEPEFKSFGELETAFKALANKSGDRDFSYLKNSWQKMGTIIRHRKELFPEKDGFHDINFQNMDINAFHNNTGLQALCRLQTPDVKLNKKAKEVFENND